MQIANGEAKLLGEILQGVGTLLDEATITIDENGLNIKEMDTTNIALIDARIPNLKGEKTEFRIDVKWLQNALKRVKDAEVELEEKGIVVKNTHKNITIPLLAGNDNRPNPNIEFTNRVKVETKKLQEAVKDIEVMGGDVVGIEFLDNEIVVKSVNEGMAILNRLQGKPKEAGYTNSYAIDYIQKILKGRGEEKVLLETGESMPIKLSFTSKDYTLNYLIAPRVE